MMNDGGTQINYLLVATQLLLLIIVETTYKYCEYATQNKKK